MFVTLTELDGMPVSVNVDNVEFVRPRPRSPSQLWAKNANAAVHYTSGHEMQIVETRDKAMAIIQPASAQ